MSNQTNFYNRFFEYARVTSDVVVTEEGVYQKDQVPTEYDGPQLEWSVVWAIFMINSKAEMQLWELSVDYPMDKDKKKGGPLVRDGVTIRRQTGASDVSVKQTLVLNESLDDQRKLLGKVAFSQFKMDLDNTPAAQPKP